MGIDINATASCRVTVRSSLAKAAAFFRSLPPLLPHCPVRIQIREDGAVDASVFGDNWISVEPADGGLSFSARTSNGGPGYHVHVVELMDALSRKAGLTWHTPEEGIGDETGYYEHRDFDLLKASMAGFVRSLAGYFLVSSRENTMAEAGHPPALCMPLEWSPIGGYCASHPQGPLTEADLAVLSAADADENALARFFPWWDKSRRVGLLRKKWEHPASLYHNYALGLIWTKINWLPPSFPEEQRYLVSALDCLDKAWRLDPNREYPVAEWLEIARLAGETRTRDRVASRFPDAGRKKGRQTMGYLRGEILRRFGPWEFRCPGAAHVGHDPASGLTSFMDKEQDIKVAANLHFEADGTTPLPAEKWIAERREKGAAVLTRKFDLGIPGVQAWLDEGDSGSVGFSRFLTFCMAVADGASIVFLIYYPLEKHKKKVRALLRTLRYKGTGGCAAASES